MSEMNEDEEESVGNIGTNRYQATPSLQALQQMRNRLHSAFLGKRLMKWTALATGKELRKISELLNLSQEPTFTMEFTQALMLLARCRYQNHEFHKVLLENVGNEVDIQQFGLGHFVAGQLTDEHSYRWNPLISGPYPHKIEAQVTVNTSSKFIGGTKIWMLEVHEDGPFANPYTCLGRGGEVLKETREAWSTLLKDMIAVLQLRENFAEVYRAYREANKKKNVMTKIVIPKTINTIRYIISELEELGREDFFRLKKIKNIQMKKKEGAKTKFPHDGRICKHVCIPRGIEEYSRVCHSCNTTIPIVGLPCNEDDHGFICKTCGTSTGSCINEYMDHSYVALSKVMDETRLSEKMREELSSFVHKFAILKQKLIEEQCPRAECGSKALVPYRPPPFIPSRFDFGQPKKSTVNVSTGITPKRSTISIKASKKSAYSVEIPRRENNENEDELKEGIFQIEFKEVTKVTRTIGEDGKITEQTEVIRTTTKTDLSNKDDEQPSTNTESYAGLGTSPASQKISHQSEIQSSKSQVCFKSSEMLTPPVRSCNSWSVINTPSKETILEETYYEKLMKVQRTSARMGVILLPAEMSNRIARETAIKKKENKNEREESKKQLSKKDSKNRHDRCFQ